MTKTMTIPLSVVDAARNHIKALEGETDENGNDISAEPSDAWNCWDTVSLPSVDGLDPLNEDDNRRIRQMLEQAISKALLDAETALSITLPDLDELRAKAAPVYRSYPQQTSAQPAFIEMDEDGAVGVDWDGIIGGGVPMDVWHRQTQRWSIPNTLTGAALADFLGREDVQALLYRIHAGHSVEWDGSNHVGRLTQDAVDASYALERLCETTWDEDEHARIWPCAEFLLDLRPLDAAGNVTGWRDYDAVGLLINSETTLSADATDEEIAALAESLEAEAKAEGIILEDDMAKFLRQSLDALG